MVFGFGYRSKYCRFFSVRDGSTWPWKTYCANYRISNPKLTKCYHEPPTISSALVRDLVKLLEKGFISERFGNWVKTQTENVKPFRINQCEVSLVEKVGDDKWICPTCGREYTETECGICNETYCGDCENTNDGEFVCVMCCLNS